MNVDGWYNLNYHLMLLHEIIICSPLFHVIMIPLIIIWHGTNSPFYKPLVYWIQKSCMYCTWALCHNLFLWEGVIGASMLLFTCHLLPICNASGESYQRNFKSVLWDMDFSWNTKANYWRIGHMSEWMHETLVILLSFLWKIFFFPIV